MYTSRSCCSAGSSSGRPEAGWQLRPGSRTSVCARPASPARLPSCSRGGFRVELVHYEVRDRVAHVTISNGKANALSPEVLAGLGDALPRGEDAGFEEVGALLISGAHGMFSGGFDLQVMRSGPEAAGKLVTDGGELFARIYGSPLPVVVACSGHAIAAGAPLLLGAAAPGGRRGAFPLGLLQTPPGVGVPARPVRPPPGRFADAPFPAPPVGSPG